MSSSCAGRYLMQHYHKRSREECFDADGWFHTGDLVRVDDDGFFYFLGRRGSMIKTAGANVSPAEVERAIVTVIGTGGARRGPPGFRARTDRRGGRRHPRRRKPSMSRRCETKLKAELSSFKIPRHILGVRAGDIPLMSSGKVDLRRLTELFDA